MSLTAAVLSVLGLSALLWLVFIVGTAFGMALARREAIRAMNSGGNGNSNDTSPVYTSRDAQRRS